MEEIIEFLSNSNLSFFENFIVWINLFFASYSGYIAYKASQIGILGMRHTFKFVTGMAWLYSISYFVLLLSDINFLAWSSTMRGVSIFAWVVVWIVPASVSIKLWKKLQNTVFENMESEIE